MASGGAYGRPDIYIIESGDSPRLLPAESSRGALVGEAVRGRTDKATLISSWSDFQRYYGGFPKLPASHLLGTMAVFMHFQNGGGPLYFVRVVGAGADGALKENLLNHETLGADTDEALNFYAQSVGAWGNALSVKSEKFETTNVNTQVVVESGDGVSPGVFDLSSLVGVEVGDVIDALDETGAYKGFAVVAGLITDASRYTTLGLVSGVNYALIATDAYLNASAGVDAPLFTFRSASRHKASTRLAAAYTADDTAITVDSVTGLQVGSFVSVMLAAINNDDAARHKALEGHGVVSSISGKVVTLTGKLRNAINGADAVTIAADTKAFAKSLWTNNGATEGFSLTSKLSGTDGNAISYEVILGAALSVAVVGNHIKITVNNGVTTTAAIEAAIVASAAASALVTAATIADGAGIAVVDSAVAKRYLTGGAFARVVSQEFSLQVLDGGTVVETHAFLSTVSTSSDLVSRRLGGTSAPDPDDNNQSTRLIGLVDSDVVDLSLSTMPRSFKETVLAGGVDGALPSDVEALGEDAQGSETGIHLLEANGDIAWVAMPGFSSSLVAAQGAAFAERNRIQFLLDTQQSSLSFDSIVNFMSNLGIDSSFLAVATPWVKVLDPRDSTKIVELPPTGGFYTSDLAVLAATRGAHYPPANRPYTGIIDLSIRFTDAQLDVLNSMGVNPIKRVAGSGFRMYGARTRYSGSDSRKFINVRLWLNYAERSILSSFGSYVLQPANKALLRDLASALNGFFEMEWYKGALYPDDDKVRAYNVKADEETTTAQDLADGTVNVEIRVSPVVPAEHIVLGLTVETGGVTLVERAA